ncbi:unnamed protein product [Arabidopsis halleri]
MAFETRDPFLIRQGGLSSGYKNRMTEKGSSDETYTMESIALIQASGTGGHNNKALQVEAVLFYLISLLLSAFSTLDCSKTWLPIRDRVMLEFSNDAWML